MWVLIDNYDSFTYILHHYLLQAGKCDCLVIRNDAISIQELAALNPQRIIISPGPETPLQAGISMAVIDRFHRTTPILGVCLGHQALGMYFGAQLIHALVPTHGKTSDIFHSGSGIFRNIPPPFKAMRYHSLSITNCESTELEITATVNDGTIMAIQHKTHPCIGVQFHPESIGTEYGLQILENWARMDFEN